MSAPRAYVFIDLDGTARRVGRLWTSAGKGRETATFEYDDAWLAAPERFALEPALMLGPGAFHTTAGRALFGALGDSAPDRWGRTLIARKERRCAAKERRAPRTLWEADYLLGVTDEIRQGALRFTLAEDGPFVADGGESAVPPLVRLPKLLRATERLLADEETDADLQLLLAPGSSLGGARPKASVRDHDGALLIAKFPSRTDEVSVPRWEALALTLARRAGVTVEDWRVEEVADCDVLLVRRFDRMGLGSTVRIPFLSAMSMIGAGEREAHSYLELADALRMHGAATREDLAALWRRIVFNVLISNTDDHLRNHGFLYDGRARGWRLSPAYDMNPVPVDVKPRVLATPIADAEDPTASLALALDVAADFGLRPRDARDIAAEVGRVVATWRAEARALGIEVREIDRMASAFEHEDLRMALG